MDGVLLCGKHKNKKFSEIQKEDEGYCRWVSNLDDCAAGSLAEFKAWLCHRSGSKRAGDDGLLSNRASKRSRLSSWLQDSLGEELEELDRNITADQRSPVEPVVATRSLPSTIGCSPPAADTASSLSAITFAGTLLLEVCSSSHFRIVGKTQSQSKFSTFLPRDLFNLLNPLRSRGQPQLVFDHGEYHRVLQLLRQTVKGGGGKTNKGGCVALEIEAIPTFVLLAFDGLRKFATRTKMQLKAANILCGTNSPTSKTVIDDPNLLRKLVGPLLLRGLKQFQRDGLVWGLTRNGRCLIGDEMGLGKTLQALAIAALYQEEWPVLVVCPSSIRFQWRDQAKIWLPHLFVYPEAEIVVVDTAKAKIPSCVRFVVTSYELLVRCDALKTGYKVIICDESHYIKSLTAKRSRVLVPMLQTARRAILLSGTPALNKPVELYQQICALLPDFTAYKIFADRYCDKKKNHWSTKFDYSGARLNDELNVLLRNTVMIRRLKKEVETELPQKLRANVPIELPSAKLEAIQLKIKSLGGGDIASASLQEGLGTSKELENATTRQIKISELFKMTGEFKAESVCEYVNDLLEIAQPNGGCSRKVIIFGHHHSVMDMIEASCLVKRRYIRIDGKTPISQREGLVKKFQERDEADVALLSITACGHGLNMTKAEIGVFTELYWVPGQIMQAEDRLHRIGSDYKCVNIYYCLAAGTLDDIVWKILVRKWEDVSKTINGEKETWHLASR